MVSQYGEVVGRTEEPRLVVGYAVIEFLELLLSGNRVIQYIEVIRITGIAQLQSPVVQCFLERCAAFFIEKLAAPCFDEVLDTGILSPGGPGT